MKMKTIVVTLLSGLMLSLVSGVIWLGVTPSVVSAAKVHPSGWVFEDNKWHYYDTNGVMKTGWLSVSGTWYYLDSSGAMKTGWLKDPADGKWYFLASNGSMKTGWLSVSGTWYYLDSSGAMKTGWLKDPANGKWYFLASNGSMKTGWLSVSGTWYYLDSSGAMKTGWLKDPANGAWYYLNPHGAMMRQNFAGGYYLMQDGRMTTSGNASVVSVVADLKKSIDVGMTQSELLTKLGSAYHDLIGLEGENYWIYSLKVSDATSYQAVKLANEDLGAEDLATGDADIIVLVTWDGTKATQVSMDYFDANHKFHHYYSARYDYEYH